MLAKSPHRAKASAVYPWATGWSRTSCRTGKAALDALTRTAALEVGAQQIRINTVCPGIIATPMASGVLATETAALPFQKHTALQRIGQPEDVADTVVWLLSDEVRFVTGQSLLVDGGFALGGLRPWFNSFVAEHVG